MCTFRLVCPLAKFPINMYTIPEAYGDMIRLNLGGGSAEETLRRIPLGTPTAQGGIDESTLQDLLFRYPQTLPIPAIDGDLQREVSKALKRTGNVLYDLVQAAHPNVDEAAFVDNVTHDHWRGEFLLPIDGDGIRQGVEKIVDFVQRHSGLHFNLVLVEAELYRNPNDRVIVQPRILTRTEIVPRVVFEAGETRGIPPDDTEVEDVRSDYQRENIGFWTAVLENDSFSDVTVEIPDSTKEATRYVKVRNSGFGDWACRSPDTCTVGPHTSVAA